MDGMIAAKIALIGVLGVGAQWLAWRVHLPAIVLLTAVGIAAGPWLGLIDPVADFGALLRPMIAIAVAFILFEGGLSLNLRELRGAGPAVVRLIAIGIPITWALAALGARFLLDLSWPIAVLFGAVLVVTGPTVIVPLLRQAHLAPRVGSLLRWEGIINDPVGALLAVMVFEYLLAAEGKRDILAALGGFALGFAAVALLGFAAGWALARAFRSSQIPEYFKAPIAFAAVLACFAAANGIQEEGGLVTVTVLGATLANTRIATIEEMRRFKEYIAVLMVGGVFILLTATLTLSHLSIVNWPMIGFLALLLFAIRPAAVLTATAGTGLTWRERALVAWIAPRGVVAIAVCGFFGTVLSARGFPDAAQMIPLSFAVVIVTVVAHGFSMSWLGRKLDLAAEKRNGVFIVGSSPWSAALAKALTARDIPVIVADSVWHHLRPARRADIPVYHGEVLSELAEFGLDLSEFGYLLAASDNDAYNALVCVAFAHELGRNRVFQVLHAPEEEGGPMGISPALRGRRLIGERATYDEIAELWARGWRFAAVPVGETPETALKPNDLAFLRIREGGEIQFNRAGEKFEPKTGDVVIALVPGKRAAGQE